MTAATCISLLSITSQFSAQELIATFIFDRGEMDVSYVFGHVKHHTIEVRLYHTTTAMTEKKVIAHSTTIVLSVLAAFRVQDALVQVHRPLQLQLTS